MTAGSLALADEDRPALGSAQAYALIAQRYDAQLNPLLALEERIVQRYGAFAEGGHEARRVGNGQEVRKLKFRVGGERPLRPREGGKGQDYRTRGKQYIFWFRR